MVDPNKSLFRLLQDIELFMRTNTPMNDGSLIHKALLKEMMKKGIKRHG